MGRPAKSRKIDVAHELIGRGAGFDPGTASDQRHPQAGLIHETFVVESEVTQIPAVVGGVDHDGVFGQAGGIEVVEDLTHVVIDPLNAGEVVAHVVLIFPLDQRFTGEGFAVDRDGHGFFARPGAELGALEVVRRHELEVAVSQVAGDGLFVFGERGGAGGVVVKQGRRLGNHPVFEQGLVALVGFPRAVGSLLVQHKEERFVGRARFQEFDPEIAGDVGAVPFDVESTVRGEEGGIPILTLAGEHDPAVKSGRVAAEVPFADHAGVVAPGLQVFGDGVAGAVETVEHRDPIEMRILTRQQGGAAGRADGVGNERISEARTAAGEAIEVRGGVDLRTVGRDRILGVIVRENEEDIRAGGGGGERGEAGNAQRGENEVGAIVHRGDEKRNSHYGVWRSHDN